MYKMIALTTLRTVQGLLYRLIYSMIGADNAAEQWRIADEDREER